ncbi:hypothetical protein NQ317_018716 [Molorchus minor]|uniref:VWFA domain-containing protein n=1 Tax=Molorchus minor TaxID=1323400 RepID=A0ABQ9JSN0_9CUCU|nr:hypothetical protein NQ317_018716 [Molorchus minor]
MEIFKTVIYNVIIVFVFITISPSSCGVDIKEVAKSFSEDIKQIKNNELGVPFIMSMAHKLETKINNLFVALDTARGLMRKHMGAMSTILKREYFISETEVRRSIYSPFSVCNECDENIIWNNYMKQHIYQTKTMVLILDIGGSIGNSQMQNIKAVAKKVISLLSNEDRIALLTIGDNYTSFKNDCDKLKRSECISTAICQRALNNYVDALITDSSATNHVLGIQKGLEIISKEARLIGNNTVMLLYVSRGLLSSLSEPRNILEAVAQFTNSYNVSLIINTCAILADLKPVMYEPQFLQDLAEQNYTKYNISCKSNMLRKTGVMLTINNSNSVPFVVNRFYNYFNANRSIKLNRNLYLPAKDEFSGDLTVSFTVNWMWRGHFYMLCADVYFLSLVEDLIYYSSNQDYSYAFLMDLQGNILIHSSFLKSSTPSHKLIFADVTDVDVLRRKLITEQTGTFNTYRVNTTDLVNYAWNRVGSYYVLCIVVNRKYDPPNRPYRYIWFQSPSENKFLYHNLKDYKLCRHLNLLATLDVNSLYLSTSCFQSPSAASKTAHDKSVIQGYLAYLKDDTRLLANPGLKEDVRDEVLALSHVLDFLRKTHLSSVMSKFIVRRYASSFTGVLQMFPGSVLKPGLRPTKRPWFIRALQHRGRVVFIPPYLDKGGAGYIVTIAYATSQLVVAMDIPYGYMLKMLLKHMSVCLDANVTCFLIDDQGYIIYHPGLMDVTGSRPVVEQQHIVHKESLVSNDILNHKYFIRKLLCNNYADNTIQRYYRLNTSFTDVLANFVPGEHCVTYRIAAVPNTNIFIGVVNASCEFVATFCPCSIVDRLCLNCNRMEQKECECPCECPLEDDNETCEPAAAKQNMTDNPPCTFFTEDTLLESSFAIDTESRLEPCFPVSCQSEKTLLGCLVLALTVSLTLPPSFTGDLASDSEYSPMGPILGSIVAMCILFILLFFCYRSYTNPLTDRLYLSSTQEQLRMSDLNVNDNTFHDLGNHRDKLLTEDSPNVVSPYCLANTYRHTPVAADSDHGYSTMTPHDESEHLSLAPVEVDSLEDDILSDSTSVHTSVSAKDAPRILSPTCTKISHKNCIIVPVTVHRNMERI